MNRRHGAVIALVIGIIILGSVQLVTMPSQTPQLEVSATGGTIVTQDNSAATIRAYQPTVIVNLYWPQIAGLLTYRIIVDNMNPARVDVVSDVDVTPVDTVETAKVVDIQSSSQNVTVTFTTLTPDEELEFFVFGDSQGYQGGLEQIVADANESLPDFLFHCGDITPFGQESQYDAALQALASSVVPVYATIGNHDIKMNGSARYLSLFGPVTYSFDLGPAHCAVFNSSGGDVSEDEIDWLVSDLSESSKDWKFVFTHIPLIDPRPEMNHTLINTTTTSRLIDIFETYGVDAVFTGHIHMFNHSVINGIHYVITGGAGANLYAPPEQGGFYHYTHVTVANSSLSIEPVPLNAPIIQRDVVIVRGVDEDATLTLNDLMSLPYVEGDSSFQNQFDNWRAFGTYRGVEISTLLEIVGGISPGDIIRVTAFDGYQQDFAYSNIYPNSTWSEIQGEMILAYQYNDTLISSWTEGLRIVMLSPDGGYSTDDCLMTSELGMGCHIYPSGGARWVSNVKMIEVIRQ